MYLSSFYLGGSFLVAIYWLMDKDEGKLEKEDASLWLMILWPLAVISYIVGRK